MQYKPIQGAEAEETVVLKIADKAAARTLAEEASSVFLTCNISGADGCWVEACPVAVGRFVTLRCA